MTNYYDLTDEQAKQMNVDYDFCACLEYNVVSFNLFDVEQVLAVIEGENDGDDWHWVARLRDGRVVYLRGGCDYTGWDCQSWASDVEITEDFSLVAAIEKLSDDWKDTEKSKLQYYYELNDQMNGKKKETWRDLMDKEFGLSKKDTN